MISVNDIARVIDGTEVIEGQVTNTFESNGIDYVQLGAKVYTMDEVTKVPNVASNVVEVPIPLDLSTEAPRKELTPALEEYDEAKDDRDDEIKSIVNEGLDADLDAAIDDVVISVNRLIAMITKEDDADEV